MVTLLKEHRGHKFKKKEESKVFWCVPRPVSATAALMDTKRPIGQSSASSCG